MFVRREAIKKAGMLDERFFMYFEDVDWCHRFWKHGYRVMYVPAAECYHYYKRVSRGKGLGALELFLNRYARTHVVSALKYFAKHGMRAPRYGV